MGKIGEALLSREKKVVIGRGESSQQELTRAMSASTTEDIGDPMESSYITMDSHAHVDDRTGRASYPRQAARSLSSTLLARAGMAPSSLRADPPAPASTTSAQLLAATVRGGISACEEQDSIERAQRDTAAIHYHAREAVRAGNELAADKMDVLPPVPAADLGPPSLARSDSTMSSGRSAYSSSSDGAARGRARSMQAQWDAVKSAGSALVSARRGGRGRQGQDDDGGGDGTRTLDERVAEMREAILRESHGKSGALLGATSVLSPDPSARDRVRLMIDNPDRADAYIRLGLREDPEMEIDRMIQMIDYYCSQSSDV